MLQSHLLKESAAVHYISRMSDYKEKLRDAIADGAWQLLQHFVCRDYKTSQRGNGAGGVHSRHNAHRLYPSHQPVKSEAKKCEDKVTVRMVRAAQATVEQDGGNLVVADVVTPVNLWLQSLWNQVDVFLQ